MLRRLEARGELVMCAATSINQLDLARLAALQKQAWSADYKGMPYMLYDETHLEWLLRGNNWTAAILMNERDEPVGFHLACFRQLLCQSVEHAAVHGTAIAVSPHYRNRGVGRWLYQANRFMIFEEAARQLSFGTFKVGHGGLATVESGVRATPGMQSANFLRTSVWQHRFDGERPRLESLRYGRLHLSAQGALESDSSNLTSPPTLKQFTSFVTSKASLAFAPQDSFVTHYLDRDCERAATLWYEIDDNERCTVGYTMVRVIVDDQDVGPVAVIQNLCGSQLACERALPHTLSLLSRAGCKSSILVDLGWLPAATLTRLGFQKTDDELYFTLRGAPEVLTSCADALRPPYFLDFI